MYTTELTVSNKLGLHARPAAELTVLCQKYSSEVTILTENKRANPKSVISILSLGIKQGTKIVLKIEGEDEKQAGEAIANFIANLKE